MEDSTAILSHICVLKTMLDRVNHEIEANIQVTREIESEILKCSQFDSAVAAKESDLTKTLYTTHFDLNALLLLARESRNSALNLDQRLNGLRAKRNQTINRINQKQDWFVKQCLEFQRHIHNNADLRTMLSEKESLQNEFNRLDKNNSMLKNSMQAFVQEILEDLHCCNCALQIEIENGNRENQTLLEEIEDLKTILLSTIVIEDDQWLK